ncbi:putative 5'-AMP-activated protein kinase; regulatory beta subunit [Paratrimastix pyriformis]|uniref:5'-AMP-activated protein kinase n=1 Tax=Paratrimastix pyriformis TaxID=342808 RepID=A0ABQ8UA35_9EUKA|nr:putative 5'-AMP-activated protein kinase; regulatory beta subunit [Paratrimastix pyriformis]
MNGGKDPGDHGARQVSTFSTERNAERFSHKVEVASRSVPFHFWWTERFLDGVPVRTVELTGTFTDNWRKRIPLNFDPRLKIFAVDTRVPTGPQSFKFVINGEQWCTHSCFAVEVDPQGNANNVICLDETTEDEGTEFTSSCISADEEEEKEGDPEIEVCEALLAAIPPPASTVPQPPPLPPRATLAAPPREAPSNLAGLLAEGPRQWDWARTQESIRRLDEFLGARFRLLLAQPPAPSRSPPLGAQQGATPTVDVTFEWPVKLAGRRTAKSVQICGEWSNWSKPVPLTWDVNRDQWICRLSLPPGRYRYKFLVDGQWLIRPDTVNEIDDSGNLNNVCLPLVPIMEVHPLALREFRWPRGARTCAVVSSIDGWAKPMPLQWDSYAHAFRGQFLVPHGRHLYRYLIDGTTLTVRPELPRRGVTQEKPARMLIPVITPLVLGAGDPCNVMVAATSGGPTGSPAPASPANANATPTNTTPNPPPLRSGRSPVRAQTRGRSSRRRGRDSSSIGRGGRELVPLGTRSSNPPGAAGRVSPPLPSPHKGDISLGSRDVPPSPTGGGHLHSHRRRGHEPTDSGRSGARLAPTGSDTLAAPIFPTNAPFPAHTPAPGRPLQPSDFAVFFTGPASPSRRSPARRKHRHRHHHHHHHHHHPQAAAEDRVATPMAALCWDSPLAAPLGVVPPGYLPATTPSPYGFPRNPQPLTWRVPLASSRSSLPLLAAASEPQGDCRERPEAPNETGIFLVWPDWGVSKVEMAGSFNGWHPRLPFRRNNQGVFTLQSYLPIGAHQVKFVVDDRWCLADWLPTCSDGQGNVNNRLTVAAMQAPTGGPRGVEAAPRANAPSETTAARGFLAPPPEETMPRGIPVPVPCRGLVRISSSECGTAARSERSCTLGGPGYMAASVGTDPWNEVRVPKPRPAGPLCFYVRVLSQMGVACLRREAPDPDRTEVRDIGYQGIQEFFVGTF